MLITPDRFLQAGVNTCHIRFLDRVIIQEELSLAYGSIEKCAIFEID
jgi:hypothetical protein